MNTNIHERKALSTRKKALFSLVVFSFFIITLLLIAEIVLRKKGFGPWIIRQQYTSLEPDGKLTRPDPDLGYLFRPGESTITLPGPFTFKMTHLSNGFRITHPLNTYPGEPKPEIWIFGCSFTHGWSLGDYQTYPWLLQEQLPKYEVVNFAIGGGSTVQSLIQFRKALAKGQKPAVLILAYASMHDERNTMTRNWVKAKLTGAVGYRRGSMVLPYMRWSAGRTPEVLYMPLDYHEVPLMHYSAVANFLDDTYNGLLKGTYQSHEISKKIIEEFASLCNANEIKFVVAGIVSDPETTEMLDYCSRKGMMTVDVSVDLGIMENTNLPYDAHPSAIADQQYARKLNTFLCGKVIEGPLCGR